MPANDRIALMREAAARVAARKARGETGPRPNPYHAALTAQVREKCFAAHADGAEKAHAFFAGILALHGRLQADDDAPIDLGKLAHVCIRTGHVSNSFERWESNIRGHAAVIREITQAPCTLAFFINHFAPNKRLFDMLPATLHQYIAGQSDFFGMTPAHYMKKIGIPFAPLLLSDPATFAEDAKKVAAALGLPSQTYRDRVLTKTPLILNSSPENTIAKIPYVRQLGAHGMPAATVGQVVIAIPGILTRSISFIKAAALCARFGKTPGYFPNIARVSNADVERPASQYARTHLTGFDAKSDAAIVDALYARFYGADAAGAPARPEAATPSAPLPSRSV